MKKYSFEETRNLFPENELTGCLVFLSQLVKNEYLGSLPLTLHFDESINVFNFDCVESIKANLEQRLRLKSMDFAFVISSTDNSEVVLVELRLNFKNPNNLDKNELEEKVFGSSCHLTNKKIYPEYFFVFHQHQIQEARNRLFRMRPVIPTNYIAISLEDLADKFFNLK